MQETQANRLDGINPRTGAPVQAPKIVSARHTIENLRAEKIDTIFFWGQELSENQLAIWLDYIHKSTHRIGVIAAKKPITNGNVVGKLRRPCVFLEDGFSLEWLALLPNLKAIIYPTDKNRNFDLLRSFPNLVHVYAHHGDSVKHSSSNRLPAAYDFMLLSDEAAILQYVRGGIQLNTDRMLVIGNYVFPDVTASEDHCQFRELLYAPTFEGHSDASNFSSVAEITDDLVEWTKIEGGFLFRPHDGTGVRIPEFKRIADLLQRISNTHSGSEKSTLFNQSDFLVADISGIISEYIYTLKPIIIPISREMPWKYNYIMNSNISKYCYLWNHKEITLPEFINSIRHDPLRSARKSRKQELYYGISCQEDSIKRFDQAIAYVHATFEFRSRAHPRLYGNTSPAP